MVNNNKWLKFLCEQQDPLDKTDYGPEESPFEHNKQIINLNLGDRLYGYKNTDLDGAESADILDEIKIGKVLGSGAFGVVFEIENSMRAIKIFKDSFETSNDIRRIEQISKDVYSGKASLKDFHVFDHGKLGDSKLYYIIMPRIIPLPKSPFYHLSEIFKGTANLNKKAARDFYNDGNTNPTFEEWKRYILEGLNGNDWDGKPFYSEEEINKYLETLNKIMEAGHRAFKEFDGQDLHKENIGYYAQKPGVFFYFDM